MSFASDRLYNGYLRRTMPVIASKVKVREIIPHLPCLTLSDREEIEAKREVYGNYNAMQYLLDCLRRRENWAEEFIRALEACEQRTLAAEIGAEYDSLRGATDNPHPGSPSATLVTAHVHPVPPGSPLSSPVVDHNSHAAVPPPYPAAQAMPLQEATMQPNVPPRPPAEACESTSPHEAPKEPSTEVFEEMSPPELDAEPSESPVAPVATAPSTPPPFPVTQHRECSPLEPGRGNVVHQEPEENSESDIGNIEVTHKEAGREDGEVHELLQAVEQYESSTPPELDLPLVTESPSQSPDRMVTEEAVEPNHFMTPEKLPIQDTMPLTDQIPAVTTEPEETTEPTSTEVTENSQETKDSGTSSSLTTAPVMDTAICDTTVCLSKPGELQSIEEQPHHSPATLAFVLPQEPYSGNSDRLEISDAVITAPELPGHNPLCPAGNTTIVNEVSPPANEGNCFAPETENHNEPEENHYECSTFSTLDGQEVLENVVTVSEEPSILNQGGQGLLLPTHIVNGETAKKPASPPPIFTTAADNVSKTNASSAENCDLSDPARPNPTPEQKTLNHPENKVQSQNLSTYAKYALTAAGFGVCALFMVLKFKSK